MAPRKPAVRKAITAPVVESKSRGLIPIGQREVIQKKSSVKHDETGKRPTTSRALILRNGKYGAMGEGQIALLPKLSGREKLDLLAEDLIERSKKAVGIPFKASLCVKIASSQYDARLDDIVALKDAELFYDNIRAEAEARTIPRVVKGGKIRSPIADVENVVAVTSTRIHNAYMLAAAWKIVMEQAKDLDIHAKYPDSRIRKQLAEDVDFRRRYLVLYDIVNTLVNAGHSLVQVLVTTTKHYAQFFKPVPGSKDTTNPEYQFHFERLQDVYKSFLDSIIIELCLPGSPTPKRILFQILHDAVDEAPREANRFSQALWDAIGDFSFMLQLQEMLETPLHGPEGEAWKTKTERKMPEVFEQWTDAQLFSQDAMGITDNWVSAVNPLERAKKQGVLDNMWQAINNNYEATSGRTIDELWDLTDAFDRTPRWAPYRPQLDSSDSDDEDSGARVPVTVKHRRGTRERRQITAGDDDEFDDQPPPLLSVSDSSNGSRDEEEEEEESEYEDEDEDEDEDEEYDYDSDDEENFKDMLRDAMNTASGIPGIFDPMVPKEELEPIPEDKKDNPFIKLLGSLRGRMFSGNPKLRTTDKGAPRSGFKAGPPQTKAPATEPTKAPTRQDKPADASQSRKATVEDVEDEDTIAAAKKKKKKPKKKKKAAVSGGGEARGAEDIDRDDEDERPAMPPPMSPEPGAAPTPGSPETLATAAAAKKKKKKPTGAGATAGASPPDLSRPSVDSDRTMFPAMSTTSLPVTSEQKAMGSKAYLAKEGMVDKKEKIKTRGAPTQAPLFPDKKGSFMSRFGLGSKKEKSSQEEEEEVQKRNWFSRLGKRTTKYMHQLLGTSEDEKKGQASMKWDNFVKVMTDMGFSYDPSTAGSSVRFDHPNARSITFHKPHPDPTIGPVMLKGFAKRLKESYGWSDTDLISKIR